MATSDAPLEIGRVALTVNDIATVGDYYQSAVGLEKISADGETAQFGAGGQVLLELRADRAARRRSAREAGLFHTAFLLPARTDLGAWLHHAAETRLPVAGTSDHAVSEAVYLTDPEGNGIEIYTDRPREAWRVRGTQIEMTTEPLDLESLFSAATAPWAGAPAGTVVGHVHLQVGSLPEAEAFYGSTLGFDLTCRYPGANFFGAGGYHHHLATNIWNSRGAALRGYPSTGLAEVEILADAGPLATVLARTAGQAEIADPWGTRISLRAKGA